MAYYPNLHNPVSRWDKRFEFVSDIITLLRQIKMKEKISIKVKDGEGASEEIKLYKKYLELKKLKI